MTRRRQEIGEIQNGRKNEEVAEAEDESRVGKREMEMDRRE